MFNIYNEFIKYLGMISVHKIHTDNPNSCKIYMEVKHSHMTNFAEPYEGLQVNFLNYAMDIFLIITKKNPRHLRNRLWNCKYPSISFFSVIGRSQANTAVAI